MSECKNERVTRDQAPDLLVRDAMNTSPKAVPADATVADLRALFENPHVRTALVLDGSTFMGVVHRDSMPTDSSDSDLVTTLANREVTTIGPDAPLSEALDVMDKEDERRLPVIDSDGSSLAGLLCLTRDREGFCQS